MTNPIGGNEPPFLESSNHRPLGDDGNDNNDIAIRISSHVGPVFSEIEEGSMRTTATERAGNDLRETITVEAPGFFSNLLQRIRSVFRGICGRNRRSYTVQTRRSLSTFLADTELVSGVEHDATPSDRGTGFHHTVRLFFQNVWSRCLAALHRTHREQIDLQGFSPGSPEGFFILACISRSLCKVVSTSGGPHLEFTGHEEFLNFMQQSPQLTIPALARLEGVHQDLSRLVQSTDNSHMLSRGLSLLLLLPRDLQNNFEEKIHRLARTDPRHPYDDLVDLAQRMDRIANTGETERNMLDHLLHLLRLDFSTSLKQAVLQCYSRFEPSYDRDKVSDVLETLLPKMHELFGASSSEYQDKQARYVLELVTKLYSAAL